MSSGVILFTCSPLITMASPQLTTNLSCQIHAWYRSLFTKPCATSRKWFLTLERNPSLYPIYPNDHETTLAELREAVRKFISARRWESYHTPKNLAMSIAIEAAEIMEHFQWLTQEESTSHIQDDAARQEVADELADVLIYCLSFANVTGIDISTCVRFKLERNETRFPSE